MADRSTQPRPPRGDKLRGPNGYGNLPLAGPSRRFSGTVIPQQRRRHLCRTEGQKLHTSAYINDKINKYLGRLTQLDIKLNAICKFLLKVLKTCALRRSMYPQLQFKTEAIPLCTCDAKYEPHAGSHWSVPALPLHQIRQRITLSLFAAPASPGPFGSALTRQGIAGKLRPLFSGPAAAKFKREP